MSATWIDRLNAVFALVCDLLALYMLLGIMFVVLMMWREHRRTRGLSADSSSSYAGGSDELPARVPPWLDRFYVIATVVMTWPWVAYWTLRESIAGDEPGGRHELQRVEAGGHDDE